MTTPPATSTVESPSVMRVLCRLGLVSAAALLVIRVLLGQMVTEKIVTALILPCGMIWYALIASLVLAATARRRTVALSVFCVWLMYTACGNGVLSGVLVRSLEARFSDQDPLQQSPFDAVIVLGGGGTIGSNLRVQGNSSGDRILLAAQLYHSGIAPQLICTGKRIVKMDGDGRDPADIAFDLLTRLGVPAAAIERLGGQNTSEEMQTLQQRFEGNSLRIGLVTSAWHLPRALRLARRQGLTPVPLPADFMSGPVEPWTAGQWITSCIPHADNFVSISRVVKEYLAALVGR